MQIGITGANGFLGFHVRAFFYAKTKYKIKLATHETFADDSALDGFIKDLDVVIHLAGVNRGDDRTVEAENVQIAELLIASLERVKLTPLVLFANSTHIERCSAYGRGKFKASDKLSAWAQTCGAVFVDMILPNIFGEFGRPYYNSAVSTFCFQLANSEPQTIHEDAEIELIHAQTVAHKMLDLIQDNLSQKVRVRGIRLKVSSLLSQLKFVYSSYVQQIIPELPDSFNIQLFNTLRSYMYPSNYPVHLLLKTDARGSLFEAVKSKNQGQTFISTSKIGVVRGEHYHTKKVERFLVLSGKAEIKLRKLFSANIDTFFVDGYEPCYLDIPTFYTHQIKNIGNTDLVTLFWSNDLFDPNAPDTYTEKVLL